jgi:MFS family permease
MVAFTDELWSGVSVVAAPSVEREHALDHAAYTLWIFTLPMLGSAVVDVALAWLSDRLRRRTMVAASLAALSFALAACAIAPSAPVLALMLALAGTASGGATGAAQGELIDAHDGDAARAMTRWTVFASSGDLVAPLAVAAALAGGWSFRGVMAAVAVLVALQAGAAARGSGSERGSGRGSERESERGSERGSGRESERGSERGSERAEGDGEEMPLGRAWALGARDARLWLALVATASCTLLDEIVAAFAALRAERDLAASEVLATGCLTALAAGSVVGALAADALIRRVAPLRIVLVSCAASLVALAAAAFTSSTAVFMAALALLGAAAAPHYPLMKALAFDRAPGTPGLVNALDRVFIVSEVGLPLALGWVADRWGLAPAMTCLALQPIVVASVALALSSRPRATRSDVASPHE